MSVRIILDSTTDLPSDFRGRFPTVAMPVFFGTEKFYDGINITHAEFYDKLKECAELPKTSQAAPADFADIFSTLDEGDEAVVLTLSSKLSGTYQSAVIAAEDYSDRIFVVDTRTVTIGAGVLAEYAFSLAESGMSARDIAEKITVERDKVRLIAMVDTLEYLHKGGRISAAVAVAGGILGFKPVICVENGEVKLLGKARGAKNGNNLLEAEIEKTGGVDFTRPVLLGYTGTDSTMLHRYVDDFSKLWTEHRDSLNAAEIGTVIGTHVGPGAIAAAFFTK